MKRAGVVVAVLTLLACHSSDAPPDHPPAEPPSRPSETATARVTTIANPPDTELPVVASGVDHHADATATVTISKNGLFVEGEPAPLVAFASLASLGEHGFPATAKRDAESDNIEPLALALGPISASAKKSGKPMTLELLADKTTPYRAFMEVLYTASRLELTHYELAGRRAGTSDRVWIAFDPPALPGKNASPHPLDLTLLVVADGYAVKTSAGNLAPDCATAAKGTTVPKKGALYDVLGLASCLEKVRRAAPDDEKSATIAASAAIDIETVLGAVDAARGADVSRFPDVHFGVAR